MDFSSYEKWRKFHSINNARVFARIKLSIGIANEREKREAEGKRIRLNAVFN